ncbi:MAG: sulfatase [Bacteroidetes bacterium]|nr:sulfatase [Bacteroidota bacterium]
METKTLLLTLLSSTTALQGICAEKNQGQRPNIIFILADDHSSAAISAYGQSLIKTPNIDRLSASGTLFMNVFVVSSLCAPSRAAILNGQYGGKSGFKRIGDVFNGAGNTLPNLLQKAGYVTGIIGKWHLKSQPLGFQYFEVIKDQGLFFNPEFFSTTEEWESNRGHVSNGYFSDIITDKSIDWLKRRDPDKPFALFVHHKAPHAPHITPKTYDSLFTKDLPVPETFDDSFDDNNSWLRNREQPYSKLQNAYEFDVYNSDGNKTPPPGIKRGTPAYKDWAYQTMYKGYYRQIANLDENVGRILDYLEQTGLDENTIVIYTSDNGWFLGDHGLFNKMWMYDESMKIPLLISYKGHIMNGQKNESFISSLDFAPTLLDYAGVEIPGSMQGRSIRPILEGSVPEDWRTSFFYHYFDQFGVPEHYGLRTEKFKLINFVGPGISDWEFYDLKNDPKEMKNQINNPAFKQTINSLKTELSDAKNKFESIPAISK